MDAQRGFEWPLTDAADAVEALARASGLLSGGDAAIGTHAGPRSVEATDSGVERMSRSLEFEVEATDITYGDVERTLRTAGPALLKLSDEGVDQLIALLDASGGAVRLVTPGGARVRVPIGDLAPRLRAPVEAPLAAETDRLLASSNVPDRRRQKARRALLAMQLGPATVSRCWMLRPPIAAPLWRHLQHARIPRRLVLFVMAYVAAAMASIGAWWLIGNAALQGSFDPWTLLAWSFLLISLVPLGLFAMWSQGIFILGVSGTLKMQLLAGAQRLDPDETRHLGVGHHLARVIESSSLEVLALAGGFYAIAGLVDLLSAACLLLIIANTVAFGLLVAVVSALALVGATYVRDRRRWASMRLRMTHDLVERMVGHRTRLAQEPAAMRHRDEDEALERYVGESKRMDRAALALSLMPRVWLLAAVVGLTPQLVVGGASQPAMAASLGAMLLAFGAFSKLTESVSYLADAAISWTQARPLLEALRRQEPRGHLDAVHPMTRGREMRLGPLLVGHDLTYRYSDRIDPALRGCDFEIGIGDRIHLSGESGGGKSTLVSLLTGLRTPASGLLLLNGLDRATLGTREWRRRVAAAPQFHENHLFSDTLAFNLLMGRRWPPTADDLRWADTVCRRLGLGDLLDRMPAGLFQVVGETGWQLSHGERSRVFMARALLQGADLVVLDECFAELDPDSLQQCLPQAADLARTLVVVAHT